ncbi:urea ABC transporter permease subunit UrtC [Halopseudomonas salegens]|uniref:Amino acid/amide ABC transporter membrane protein 2, HAAT family n=1 Tax=Halopseudomonas salegens TaxID=1434072 RepID=A0A1H2FDU8_9GAMM|nr:urea ABC transporter permease subunit UrtC [Halopseudomonas salegens]SDU05547.1 amino acid/amide ABC transporter membrane protein 2, HAAT family [Halopseudomonas salegens]
MPFNNFKEYMTRQDILAFAVLALLLLLVLPLSLDIMRLSQIGKYLSYAFVAVGLVLCWGYGGILSLGQGVFYGLGGYALAMYLKLEASSPENTSIQTTPGIPDFMDWNRITELPWFWEPFNSLIFTLIAVVVVPSIVAYLVGVAMFKRRVGGVYFAIITQSIAAILTILIIGQQGFTGGVNGITDLRTLNGWDIHTDFARYVFYFACVVLLFTCLFIAQFIRKSKTGRILVAMRGQEDRVRFSGYDIANFKIFVFMVGAAFAGIGGAMFTIQEGFMSPSFVGVVPSIEMVIFCAVGGRLSLVGAVYGALLVNVAKTTFGETFPELWLFAMGLIFIGVVLGLPDGVAGLYNRWLAPHVDRLMDRLLGKEKNIEEMNLETTAQGASS